MTSNGQCSWFQFAKKIFEILELSVDLIVASSNEFPGKADRPKYSVLENRNLAIAGIEILPLWDEGLYRYLSDSGIKDSIK